MFLVSWKPPAFDRMQEIVRAHPELKTEFVYAPRSLTTEQNRAADTWGESRWENYRLGFVGMLEVMVRLDPDNSLVEVVDVKLR
jgi:hypothetical protein